MRPCMIGAPYGDPCVEKILAPKSKYVDTPKQAKITVPVILFQWYKTFEFGFGFLCIKTGF